MILISFRLTSVLLPSFNLTAIISVASVAAQLKQNEHLTFIIFEQS